MADPNEVWMFHILPDETGTTAVWAAQRVPDGHVAVCANAFVIRGVDPASPDFLYSDNLWAVAERNGLTHRDPATGLLDFTRTFGVYVAAEAKVRGLAGRPAGRPTDRPADQPTD